MLSQSEIARDEVYVFREDYYHLKALNFLMNEKAPRNDAIIAFIKKYNISVDVQLPVQNVKGIYFPLIYKCMLDNRFQKVTKYLIKCGANVNQLPNSDKITELTGFKPQFSVEDAIRDLCQAFREGKLPNSLTDDKYFNVKTMKKIGAV